MSEVDRVEVQKSPSISETLEWVEQYHYKCTALDVEDYCGHCGSKFPCAIKRLADQVKQLREERTLPKCDAESLNGDGRRCILLEHDGYVSHVPGPPCPQGVENTRLRAENAKQVEALNDLVEYVMGSLSYMTSDEHPLDKARAALPSRTLQSRRHSSTT